MFFGISPSLQHPVRSWEKLRHTVAYFPTHYCWRHGRRVHTASYPFCGPSCADHTTENTNATSIHLSIRIQTAFTQLQNHTNEMRQPASAKSSISRRFCAREHLLSHTKIERCFNIAFSCHTMPYGISPPTVYSGRTAFAILRESSELHKQLFFVSHFLAALVVAFVWLTCAITSCISVWLVRHTNFVDACLYPCPCGPRRVIDSCCCYWCCCCCFVARIFSVSFVWFLCIQFGFYVLFLLALCWWPANGNFMISYFTNGSVIVVVALLLHIQRDEKYCRRWQTEGVVMNTE